MASHVQITVEEYLKLKRAAEKLRCLEAGGVDNWEGFYESTREFYNKDELEE